MSSCCEDKSCEIEALRGRQAKVLKAVLAINAAMFVVEAGAGLISGSIALLADSLDMLGDALVYGVSLYAVTGDRGAKAKAALCKGWVMAAFGLFVLAEAGYRVIAWEAPAYGVMSAVGLLALAANGACLALLTRHRYDDINMTSVFVCSRNDVVANLSVLLAAGAVWMFQSPWPDVVVGVALASLFLRSAWSVVRSARDELRRHRAAPAIVAVRASVTAPFRPQR